jgi:hypothetical protein
VKRPTCYEHENSEADREFLAWLPKKYPEYDRPDLYLA